MIKKILLIITSLLMFVFALIGCLLLIADIDVNVSLAAFNKIFVIKTIISLILFVLVYILNRLYKYIERRLNSD